MMTTGFFGLSEGRIRGVPCVHSLYCLPFASAASTILFISLKCFTMKTTDQVRGKNDIQNTPDKSSLPKGNVNNPGVKNAAGIPDPATNKGNPAHHPGNNINGKRNFSNERHIF